MNLFLITAPFQVVNAIEFINYFNTKNNVLYILLTLSFTKAHYDKIIHYDKEYWKNIKYINFFQKFVNYDFSLSRPNNFKEKMIELYQTIDQLIKRQKLDFLAKSWSNIDCLVLGTYRSDYNLHFRHFANRIKCNHVYVLDVGTNTLDYLNEKRGEINYNHVSSKTIKNRIRNYFVDWDSYGIHDVTYFTCYSSLLNKENKAIKNNYNFLNAQLNNNIKTNKVIFLGESLVQDNFMDLKRYIEYLIKIKNYFDNCMIYVAHPREDNYCLDIIKRKINMQIIRYDVPVELALAKSSETPAHVASFFSSALINLSVIYEDIFFKSFFIKDCDLLKNKKMVFQIYSYIEKNCSNISIVSL
jgi:hypothetical protein